MRWVFVAVLLAHGLIHFMGFAKAFGLAELPQLTQPLSRSMGIVWLAAGLAVLVAAVMFLAGFPAWWMAGLVALVLSQVVISSSWTDAKFGTIANVILLAGVVYGFAAEGPLSLRAEYRQAVGERAAAPAGMALVTEADLTPQPELLKKYLRVAGAVGQPRVRHFRAAWRGRIRSDAASPWMTFIAEQHNFPGEPSRFFFMDAKRGGLPVDVLHVFRAEQASMRVRLLSLLPLVEASGPELTRAEVVTLFNDICLLAPSELLDPAIRWEAIDTRSVRGHYTVGAHTVSAVLAVQRRGRAGGLRFRRPARRLGGRLVVHASPLVHAHRRLPQLRPAARGRQRRRPVASSRGGVYLHRARAARSRGQPRSLTSALEAEKLPERLFLVLEPRDATVLRRQVTKARSSQSALARQRHQ